MQLACVVPPALHWIHGITKMTDRALNVDAFLQRGDTLTPCSIHVSEPIDSKDDDFYCLVRLPPILINEKKIFGADAVQATELAISFLKQMVAGMSIVDSHGKPLDWSARF